MKKVDESSTNLEVKKTEVREKVWYWLKVLEREVK